MAPRSGGATRDRTVLVQEPPVAIQPHAGEVQMNWYRWTRTTATAIVVLTLAACASVSPPTADPAVTLRLGDAEDQGRSSQPWIDEFIRRVTADSNGSITIEPVYNAGGGNEDKPGEIVVAEQLVAGDFELALVPVRAWSDAGVT